MIYYKVFHFFITKQKEHFHFFNIGIYDSLKNANDAIEKLKTKQGFSLRTDKFYIIKTVKFKAPDCLNKTFFEDGFKSCKY
jgi:hypothetical protein